MGGGVAGGVAVAGVSKDHQGVGSQAEREGAFDGAGGAVAGLTDAQGLTSLGEDDLDGPAGGVPGDGLLGRAGQVGRDQREVVVPVGVAQQDQAHGQILSRAVPLDELVG
ncbi:MAG: hypothetical protein QG597_5074 [Actinomycetota bacterium]|nr:hypothetical protein [Actinomycetota bacterium]